MSFAYLFLHFIFNLLIVLYCVFFSVLEIFSEDILLKTKSVLILEMPDTFHFCVFFHVGISDFSAFRRMCAASISPRRSVFRWNLHVFVLSLFQSHGRDATSCISHSSLLHFLLHPTCRVCLRIECTSHRRRRRRRRCIFMRVL